MSTVRTSVAGGTATPSTAASVTLTPVAGDLLVAFVTETGTGPLGSTTALNDDHVDGDPTHVGARWTRFATASFDTGAGHVSLWVRKWVVNNTTSTIITYTPTGSPTTGIELVVLAIAGMNAPGELAVRQVAEAPNGTSGAVVATFPDTTLTGNTVIVAIGNLTNPPGLTNPASFTVHQNVGQAVPLGLEVAARNSGHTSTTVTWGGTSTSNWGGVAIELDANMIAPITEDWTDHGYTVVGPTVANLAFSANQSFFAVDGYNDGYAVRGKLSRSRTVLEIKQNSAQVASVFMQSAAGVGIEGLADDLTIAIKKANADFIAFAPTITDQGDGWYDFTLTSTETDVLGLLLISVTGPDVMPNNDLQYNVVAVIHSDVATNVSTVSTSVSSINVTINGVASNLSTVASAVSSASSSIGAVNSAVGSVQTTAASIGTALEEVETAATAADSSAGTLAATVSSVGTAVTSVQTEINAVSSAVSSATLTINNIVNDVTGIAAAVSALPEEFLDAMLSDHGVSGTFGEGIAIAVGMLQGNFLMDNITNTDNGQTQARMRLFRTPEDVAAATSGGTGEGEFATFIVTTTYSEPGKVASHRVVQQ